MGQRIATAGRRAGDSTIDIHDEKRGNAIRASTSDPDARPFKKAKGREPEPLLSRPW